MKEKILYLVIGVIIGGIITTGVFMIVNKNSNQFERGGFRNFNSNNLPEDFDMNNMPQGGPGGQKKGNQNNLDEVTNGV